MKRSSILPIFFSISLGSNDEVRLKYFVFIILLSKRAIFFGASIFVTLDRIAENNIPDLLYLVDKHQTTHYTHFVPSAPTSDTRFAPTKNTFRAAGPWTCNGVLRHIAFCSTRKKTELRSRVKK